MQYLRWRQSFVKREGKLGILLYSFLKYFSFFVADFFFRYELSNNSWLYSHKKFYVISLRRFKFFGEYIRHIRGNLKAISFLLLL